MMYMKKNQAKQLTRLSSAVAAGMLITACGGGGSGSLVKQTQSISFTKPQTLAAGETAKLAATASSKLPVSYTVADAKVCTVAKDTVKAIKAGTCKVTATQVGNANFSLASSTATFSIVSKELTATAEGLAVGSKSGVINLSGKPVTKGMTATLAGKKVAVIQKAKYQAQITATPTMAGQLPLVVKKGSTELYSDVITVAVPKATGTAYTVKKTGITTCGNATANDIACDDATKLGDYKDLNQDGDVKAGADMAYTKVAHQATRDGKKVMEYCVYDNVTGLTWEQKTDDDGLRDKDWKYTWYDNNSKTNGGVAGIEAPKKDSCNKTLAKCNSENYLKKLNDMSYCGFSDWRLPTGMELLGIRDFGKEKVPYINSIFENIVTVAGGEAPSNGHYLTNSSHAIPQSQIPTGSQQITLGNFSRGTVISMLAYKNAFGHHVMAVRSGQ